MALGGKLVEQFKLREDDDTLGQWMAHHLAEKLTACKMASGASKKAVELELTDLILKFWKHRANLPRGIRPFEGYDAVLRALESFDPRPDEGRYFHFQRADDLGKDSKPPSQAWIDTAKNFDRGARALVNLCFRQAARASDQPDDAWLSAANVLAEETDRDILVVKFLRAGEKGEDQKIDPVEFERKKLEKQRDHLLELLRGGITVLKLVNDALEETEAGRGSSGQSERKSRGSSVGIPKPKESAARSSSRSSKPKPKKKAAPRPAKAKRRKK